MSRVTDEDLRAAFRRRAVGRPRPGLRQRIRSATLRPPAPRVVPEFLRRPILVRLTAAAAVAAVVVLAPLIGAQSDVSQRHDLVSDSPLDQPAFGVHVDTEDDDDEHDDDDEGDGEDGVDEVDDGADEDEGDDDE